MNIVTLTLNPAFDVHCTAEAFAAHRENFASVTSREAGGKGINVSRALCSGGTENTAIAVLGEENGQEFERILASDGLKTRMFYTPGRIRENITVHAPDGESRLSFSGPEVSPALLDAVREEILRMAGDGDFLIFSGSLPSGISVPAAVDFLKSLSEKGIRVVTDCRSFGMKEWKEIRPYLIKPNEEEIAHCLQKSSVGEEEMLAAARELYRGGVRNVMISLGKKGALLVCGDGEFSAVPPACPVVSTIGAGDSSIAGFVAAAACGEDTVTCLKTAMAYGCSACKTEGTRPPRKEDILSALGETKAERCL